MLPQKEMHEVLAERVIPDLARLIKSAALEVAGEDADVFDKDDTAAEMIHALYEFLGQCSYEPGYGDTPMIHPCQLTPDYARAFWADELEAQ